MTFWTCTRCGHKYNEVTGDTDERMCHRCLNETYGDDDDYNSLYNGNDSDDNNDS